MAKAPRKATPAPAPAEPLRLIESLVGSIDGTPVLFTTALWTRIWTESALCQFTGGTLAIPPGKVLTVRAELVDEAEQAERVAIARQGVRTGDDFDVIYAPDGAPPRGVGRA
jgi:hypothetical protein